MQVKATYRCTVCAFDGLKSPPADHVICPCCGTQFGLDDEGPRSKALMQQELRERWIARGAHWYSKAVPAPQLWNPATQLHALGLMESAMVEGRLANR